MCLPSMTLTVINSLTPLFTYVSKGPEKGVHITIRKHSQRARTCDNPMHLCDPYCCHLRDSLSVCAAWRPVDKFCRRCVNERVGAMASIYTPHVVRHVTDLCYCCAVKGIDTRSCGSEISVWPLASPAGPSFDVKVGLHSVFNVYTGFAQTKGEARYHNIQILILNQHLP
jgi:hypothetical protein